MLTNETLRDMPQGGSSSKKSGRIKLPKYSRLNQRLILEFDSFLGYVPPERLARNLRNLLLLHLEYEKERSKNFYDLLVDLYFLFQFLDAVTDELKEG